MLGKYQDLRGYVEAWNPITHHILPWSGTLGLRGDLVTEKIHTSPRELRALLIIFVTQLRSVRPGQGRRRLVHHLLGNKSKTSLYQPEKVLLLIIIIN